MLRVLVALCLAVACSATVFTIDVGALNTVSFSPSALTIAPGDTVNFAFKRQGDSVISSANNQLVCPDGFTPQASSCAVSPAPVINITGPGSGQPLFTTPVLFNNVGVFSVVNPTYCQVPGTAELSCNAKAIITVAVPTPTPAPGATIIVIGINGSQTAFPSPLVVTTGNSVWFRFDTLAGVVEVDQANNVVPGGLSCAVVSSVGSFCKWDLTEQRSYYYLVTPFNTFGGRIDSRPNPVVPPGAIVVLVGQPPLAFTAPVGNFPVGSMVFFRFVSYGPHRVRRGDGPTCQPFVGTGAFDSLYQEAGRVWPVGIDTEGLTYFLDPTYCQSNNMRSQLVASGATGGGEFVDVIVAPRNPISNLTELVFDPNPVVVFQGGSVRWIWTDFGHTVTASANNDMNSCLPNPAGFDSGFVQPPVNGVGGTFVQRFDTLGTYYYHCKAHCNQGMRGAVQVVPRPENVITHGVVADPVNPNRFRPPVISVYPNETVCWVFETAGDVVQSEFFGECIPLAGGFNSGQQPVGARVCRDFGTATCTAFYYYDSALCSSQGMYGVVLLSDRPQVLVRAATSVFQPNFLNVTVGQTVQWRFEAAGNSVTEIPSLAQVASADENVRCAVLPSGFNSGVITNAPATFSQTFNADRLGMHAYITTPFCPFPGSVPGFFGSVNVCDPIRVRPTTTTVPPTTSTTASPTTAPPTTAPPPTCPPDNPCEKPVKKTVINFYFADILAGARTCPTCGTR